MSEERLELTGDGHVRLALRRPWADGTTQLLFDPVELLERLAALTPRPRINLTLYHGVLAPRAAWRSLVVQFGAVASPGTAAEPGAAADGHPEAVDCCHRLNTLWAELMRRSLGLDVLACPRCGGRFRLIAFIEDPAVIQRILRHRGLPTEMPEARPARAPPEFLLREAPVTQIAHEPMDPA